MRSRDGGLLDWEQCGPVADPGWYAEMEVPHLLADEQGQRWIAFSGWAKHDAAPFSGQVGGLQAVKFGAAGEAGSEDLQVLLPESSGLYACRVIPELGGEIVGFDIEQGGIRRSGVQVPFEVAKRSFLDVHVA